MPPVSPALWQSAHSLSAGRVHHGALERLPLVEDGAVVRLRAVFLAGVDVAYAHNERDVGILIDRAGEGRSGHELRGVGRRSAVRQVADDGDVGLRVRTTAAGGEQGGNDEEEEEEEEEEE